MQVKIIADSISPSGVRLTTFQLKYPRFIHSELMTHRVFSRNASSSRAIPVMTMLKQVWNDPATPVSWGKNKSGMQAETELQGASRWFAKKLWSLSGKVACVFAYAMTRVGLHKQVANRILEPWQYIHVVLSATEFDNFFELRNHPDAQPEIQELAKEMQRKYNDAAIHKLEVGGWHLPYIQESEKNLPLETLKKVSAARCCRVSYLKHDGHKSTIEEDIKLHDRLVNAVPPHMSPVEHQAMCTKLKGFQGNFRQWKQYRKFLES